MKRLALLLAVIMALLFTFLTTHSQAALYKWKDKKGQVHITDYPPPPEEVGIPPEGPERPAIKKQQPEVEEQAGQAPVPLVQEQTPPPPTVVPPRRQEVKPQGVLKIPVPEKKPIVRARRAPQRPRRPVVRRGTPHRVPTPQGPAGTQLLALLSFGGLFYMVLLIGISLLIYFYTTLALHIIGKKRGVSYAWTVWIPLVNSITGLLVLIASAGRPLWWVVFFFLPFAASVGAVFLPVLSVVSLVLSLGVIVLVVVLWMDISRALGLNRWLGLLILLPVANLIFMGYLAFKREPEEEVQINKKKMVLVAGVVYVVLVVASAVAVQYVLIPYVRDMVKFALRAQMQGRIQKELQQLPGGGRISSEVFTKQKGLPPVQPMSPEAYERVLQRKAPNFGSGPATYAGPVAIKADQFWDDPKEPHLWLKVRIPPVPNISYGTVSVEVERVMSINGADLYNRQSIFERSEGFKKVSLMSNNGFVEGIRDVHLLQGTKRQMIKEIKGRVVLALPLNLSVVDLQARKGATVRVKGTTLRVEETTPQRVRIRINGPSEVAAVRAIGHDKKEYPPTMSLTSDVQTGKRIDMTFPTPAEKLRIVLKKGQHLKTFAFSLRVQ